MQAQALFLGRHYRRAYHLLNASKIVLRDLRFRYLAAKCLEELKEWDQCLLMLGDAKVDEHGDVYDTKDCNVMYLDKDSEDREINISAATCFLRGRAYEALENRALARQWYKAAIKADPLCYEALECLIENHMLTCEEETRLLSSLQFGPEDGWLSSFYSCLIKKYDKKSVVEAKFKNVIQLGMEGPENLDEAAWTKEMLHVFCDLCIEAIYMGMRPNTNFNKAGWKYLLTAFKEQTGHAFTKTQLKNKWDGCKKDWRIWTKLISEIGVGWSNELGTISASDEWWKTKIQEIRGAKKFRQSGIEPSLLMKFDRMFSNIVATGKYAWAPSSGVLYDDSVEDPNANEEQLDLEEGSSDSEEDEIPNFTDDVSNMVRGVNMYSNSNTCSSRKRKERERVEVQAREKKRSSEIGMQLLSRWDQMVDSLLKNSDSTSINRDKKGCSIHEVMTELHSIEGVHIGDDFHGFASEVLGFRRNREMWSTMGNLENKMKWLQKMYTRRKAS
ncbi:hypothetical protein NC652_004765 [Populus alba x Populus x berolinensis]|nr:hypothetical protein NC652_004765 [Populus alba x Populus x berolinensis]